MKKLLVVEMLESGCRQRMVLEVGRWRVPYQGWFYLTPRELDHLAAGISRRLA